MNGKEPNNWERALEALSGEFDEHTGMYYLHLFSKKQPDLNWENEEVRHKIYDMMNWWCEKESTDSVWTLSACFRKLRHFQTGVQKGGLRFIRRQ